MSLVEDVNAGQQKTDAPQPTENGLFEAEAALTKKSSGATSSGGILKTPPRGTPCRRVLSKVDFVRSIMTIKCHWCISRRN